MNEQRQRIVDCARSWIDAPYKHAGRSRHGIDCAGVIIKVAHECGISRYDTQNYPKRPNPQDFLRALRGNLQRIEKAEATHGSVLVFREPRHPCHVGILDIDELGNQYVIHAYAPARKVIREPLTPERWSRCMMAFDYHGSCAA